MPQDNTQIEPENNQMVAGAPSSNDAVNPVPTSVPVEPAAYATDAPIPSVPVPTDIAATAVPEPVAPENPEGVPEGVDIRADVATKIGESKNVLIALSGDPSVDELSAAIGLSLYLDKIGKRATAIYSGATPNTLEFLKPEETFEPSADTLQDFVIAINKDKADHLRYKLDGDYVKVYITPYKHRLSENDLEFSYGDYNVDLVIALDVANGIDLDSALREHGRIMHDASIVNVTTGNPGKFGEIEWSDKKASSISEMIASLLYDYGGENPIAKDEATAFLTGIVAATNRFSNPKTTPVTMRLSSRLMESGANQVLVSKNITSDTENEIFNSGSGKIDISKDAASGEDISDLAETSAKESEEEADPTSLEVEHKPDETSGDDKEPGEGAEKKDEKEADESSEVNADITKKEHTLLDDLKEAEESLAHTGQETTPTNVNKLVKIENGQMTSDGEEVENEPVLPEPVMPEPAAEPVMSGSAAEPVASEGSAAEPVMPEPAANGVMVNEPAVPEVATPELKLAAPVMPETNADDAATLEPIANADANANMNENANKYGQMLEEALKSATDPVEPAAPIMSEPDAGENPAVSGAPAVPTNPEINGVPEINYMPSPDAEVLPPPPTPPIDDLSQVMPPADGAEVQPIAPAEPVVEPEPAPLGEQPAMQDQVYNAQANDPGAFKIPGM